MDKKGFLILHVLSMVLLVSFCIRSVDAQILRWKIANNPSALKDAAYDVAVSSSGVYVAGYDSVGGDIRWRIERRDLTNGASLVPAVKVDPSTGTDIAYALAVQGTSLYVVGCDRLGGDARWRIEKRDSLTLALIWSKVVDPSSGDDIAYDVAVGSGGLYVVGSVSESQWRIDRRSLFTGNLATTVTFDPSSGSDIPYAVATDSTGLYVAGCDRVGGDARFRLEKMHLWTLAQIWGWCQDAPGADIIYDMAIGFGNLYVVGYDSDSGDARWKVSRWRLSGDGGFLGGVTSDPSTGDDIAYGVAVSSTNVYIVGTDKFGGNTRWRIEKRSPNLYTLLWSAPANPSNGDDRARSIAVDSTGIYIVGYDQAPGNLEWRIEKRQL